jgi:hypothetical protein
LGENDPDRLESWKEIATFVGRTERTAMRWADGGMPVRKVRGRVVASRAEITRWLSSHPDPESIAEVEATSLVPAQSYSGKKFALFGVSALIIILVLTALLISSSRHPVPQSVPSKITFRDSGFDVLDETGHLLWTHVFNKKLRTDVLPKAGDYQSLNELARIDDFFGDGHREVLVVLPFSLGQNPNDLYQPEADMFDASGKPLWSYIPRKTYRFGDHTLEGPWIISAIFVSDRNPTKAIWIASLHYIWGNTLVAQLDPRTGAESVRFVNTGSVHTLNEMKTSQGTFLLVGGFNNEYDSGSLAIIDESKPFAVSPQTAGTRHKCMSCPSGDPDYYFVFPRTEINLNEKVYENAVRQIDVPGDAIKVYNAQTLNPGSDRVIYSLRIRPTTELVSVRYDSGYDMLHRELSAQKKLDHSLENCPERLHPKPARMWTPAAGWVNLPVKPAKASD